MEPILDSGEPWILKDDDTYDLECCDCGSTHIIRVEINGKEATLRLYKDSYETKRIRKEEKIIVYRKKI